MFSAIRLVPLIIATALLMENIDSAVLSTSLPQIAHDLGTDPIHLKLVLTTYLLALAVFIPLSGWAADRFGARLVFRLAIVVFAAGSVACGLSSSLFELVLARALQGAGGSMMVPVGRLILLRATPKAELVSAMAWLTVPALLGPVLGPPLGGYITTYWDWRWIFWINIPIAVLGSILASIYIPDIREQDVRSFDSFGFLLLGPGLAGLMTGMTLMGLGLAPGWVVATCVFAGLGLTLLYVWHALRVEEPLVDLRLLKLPTFRINATAGTLFRIGTGALPFLLPLMLQLGFGLTAFQSGLLTLASGAGALTMKFAAQTLLRRFGFRRVLAANAVISSLFVLAPAFFTPHTPWLLMAIVLFVGGVSRSLQYTSMNVLAYADVPPQRLSNATSFSSVLQQLSGSVGITLAAMLLEGTAWYTGGTATDIGNFKVVFCLVAVLSLVTAPMFTRLQPGAGAALVPRNPDAND